MRGSGPSARLPVARSRHASKKTSERCAFDSDVVSSTRAIVRVISGESSIVAVSSPPYVNELSPTEGNRANQAADFFACSGSLTASLDESRLGNKQNQHPAKPAKPGGLIPQVSVYLPLAEVGPELGLKHQQGATANV